MSETNDSSVRIEVERHDDQVVVRPHGRLSEPESQELSREMTARIEQGASRLILDLSDVPFLSSACLGAFMAAHKLGRTRGTPVLLAGLQPLVEEIFVTTKLTKVFPLHSTVQEALEAP